MFWAFSCVFCCSWMIFAEFETSVRPHILRQFYSHNRRPATGWSWVEACTTTACLALPAVADRQMTVGLLRLPGSIGRTYRTATPWMPNSRHIRLNFHWQSRASAAVWPARHVNQSTDMLRYQSRLALLPHSGETAGMVLFSSVCLSVCVGVCVCLCVCVCLL